jgi:hypothetical protein
VRLPEASLSPFCGVVTHAKAAKVSLDGPPLRWVCLDVPRPGISDAAALALPLDARHRRSALAGASSVCRGQRIPDVSNAVTSDDADQASAALTASFTALRGGLMGDAFDARMGALVP